MSKKHENFDISVDYVEKIQKFRHVSLNYLLSAGYVFKGSIYSLEGSSSVRVSKVASDLTSS
jgi:hypothetical protein